MNQFQHNTTRYGMCRLHLEPIWNVNINIQHHIFYHMHLFYFWWTGVFFLVFFSTILRFTHKKQKRKIVDFNQLIICENIRYGAHMLKYNKIIHWNYPVYNSGWKKKQQLKRLTLTWLSVVFLFHLNQWLLVPCSSVPLLVPGTLDLLALWKSLAHFGCYWKVEQLCY